MSIRTKYHGPTSNRAARITATSAAGQKITIAIRHDLDTAQRHAVAAEMLCQKLNWTGSMVQGFGDDGYVFVFVD